MIEPPTADMTPVPEAYARAVREARETLERLPDAAIFVFDSGYRLCWAGGAALRRGGHDPAEIVGRELADVLPAAAWARLAPVYERVLAGEEEVFSYESPITGRVYWVHAAPAGDGDQRGATVVAQEVPVPERPLAVDAPLLVTEVRAMVLDSSVPTLLVNIAGRITIANPPAAELLGRTVTDLVEARLDDLVHPDDRVAARRELMDLLAGAGARSRLAQRRLVRPAGEVVVAAVSTMMFRDASGAPLYAAVQLRDVSSVREAELRLGIRLRQQHAVSELGRRALAGGRDLPGLMEEACALVADTLAADGAAVGALMPDASSFRVVAERGLGARGAVLPVEGTLFASVLQAEGIALLQPKAAASMSAPLREAGAHRCGPPPRCAPRPPGEVRTWTRPPSAATARSPPPGARR
ncbi:MAG TPA: PAS domain S-box protein, partial [Miltoncostaeaceae bacterium]|nr:PAS domain S-box protein [Miltoncostaeaceae bacterium]